MILFFTCPHLEDSPCPDEDLTLVVTHIHFRYSSLNAKQPKTFECKYPCMHVLTCQYLVLNVHLVMSKNQNIPYLIFVRWYQNIKIFHFECLSSEKTLRFKKFKGLKRECPGPRCRGKRILDENLKVSYL